MAMHDHALMCALQYVSKKQDFAGADAEVLARLLRGGEGAA